MAGSDDPNGGPMSGQSGDEDSTRVVLTDEQQRALAKSLEGLRYSQLERLTGTARGNIYRRRQMLVRKVTIGELKSYADALGMPSWRSLIETAPTEPPASERNLHERKRKFRSQFVKALAATPLTLDEIARRARVEVRLLKRWRREGVAEPSHEQLFAVAGVLGIDDPWSLIEGNEANGAVELSSAARAHRAAAPRQADPLLRHVIDDNPERFAHWTSEQMQYLIERCAECRARSESDVEQLAASCELVWSYWRKFRAVMESSQAELLRLVTDWLYQRADERGQ